MSFICNFHRWRRGFCYSTVKRKKIRKRNQGFLSIHEQQYNVLVINTRTAATNLSFPCVHRVSLSLEVISMALLAWKVRNIIKKTLGELKGCFWFLKGHWKYIYTGLRRDPVCVSLLPFESTSSMTCTGLPSGWGLK